MNSLKTILDGIATEAVEDSEPQTHYIRVTEVPLGGAPDWVRERWVGLVLPLSQDQTTAFLIDPKTKERVEGFSVDGREAFKVLHSTHPDASEWWMKNCPQVKWHSVKITFNTSVCEFVS